MSTPAIVRAAAPVIGYPAVPIGPNVLCLDLSFSGVQCATPERFGAKERGHVFCEAILGRDRSMAMPAHGQATGMSPDRARLIFADWGQLAEEHVRGGDIV